MSNFLGSPGEGRGRKRKDRKRDLNLKR